MVVSPFENNFYLLEDPPIYAVDLLKRVVPSQFRFFVNGQGWALHEDYLLGIAKVCHSNGDRVVGLPNGLDSQLPPPSKKSQAVIKAPISTAYQTLHLTTNAPISVVEAAWKALAKEHHPDLGGDAEKFKTIKKAYDRIKDEFSRPDKTKET